ncbi:unnamed protein product [Phytomonas sp. EM1]|nr:unnamed protein product [Phytomonas sp. EM1]|eukprot:CCW63384.1 unnamed protein product [Phytomonas sp. isolate EM1]
MYAPFASLFTSPARYVNATTQPFAFARARNVLLQARLGRVEAFRMDTSHRHWIPLFAQNLRGGFHLAGLWCDPRLHFFVFATDARVGVCQLRWRRGAEAALAIRRIEEVLELPAHRGVLDAVFTPPLSQPAGEATEAAEGPADEGTLHLLYDDEVVSITLAEGFPVVHTSLDPDPGVEDNGETPGKRRPRGSPAGGFRPRRLGWGAGASPAAAGWLFVYGEGGVWRFELTPDGMPRMDSVRLSATAAEIRRVVRVIPTIHREGGDAAGKTTLGEDLVVGISPAEGRYVCRSMASLCGEAEGEGKGPHAEVALPASLPHDVVFIAGVRGAEQAEGTTPDAPEKSADQNLSRKDRRPGEEPCRYLGYFSRGLIYAGARDWKMIGRASVEAAFVMKDGRHVLILERNLEKALEMLPMCWKVRRFGN